MTQYSTSSDRDPAVLARRLQTATLAACVLVAVVYIASAAHLGIGGDHRFRQALTYGHILGFTGDKGFTPFDLFTLTWREGRFVFDMPLYQYLVAKASLLAGSDPLVMTRYVNLALWLLTAFAGYWFSKALSATATAGVAFIFLFSTSPLILHFYSAPMPDLLAIALAMTGIALLHRKMRGGGGTIDCSGGDLCRALAARCGLR